MTITSEYTANTRKDFKAAEKKLFKQGFTLCKVEGFSNYYRNNKGVVTCIYAKYKDRKDNNK